MDSPSAVVIGCCTFFAAASPFILISIREAVKYQRQEIIMDLADVFDIENATDVRLIPSFEFVKYKYFVGNRRLPSIPLARPAKPGSSDLSFTPSRYRRDFTALSWIISCSPYSALVGSLVFLILSHLAAATFDVEASRVAQQPEPLDWLRIGNVPAIWALGLGAAFSASYLTSLRNLYRAVKNFDLSPGTIIGETVKILLSLVIAPVITVVSLRLLGDPLHHMLPETFADRPSFITAIVAATCFVAGTMPDVALRKVIRRDYINNYKHEEAGVFNAFKITPLEIIDGIDSDIRVRLEDHHIHSAQNLAAANPLMLFVETPFGVYQIMDWVAQAQLCCSVGRDKLIRIWAFGIRTLFDLERLADRRDEASEALLIEIGRVILGTALVPHDVANPAATADLVRASIELRLDDPHVQRLRQIYIAVSHRLGGASRRFRKGRYRIVCRGRSGRSWGCRGLRDRIG